MLVLILSSISKTFRMAKSDSMPVLSGINLTVREGKSHILLGSSGSGKSTLLKIAMGLIGPDSGSVSLSGETLNFRNAKSRSAWLHRLGYVPQDGGLFPHLTARKNVTLVAETLGWEKLKIENRLQELAEIFSLEAETLTRFPHELSGGQRQRFAVMRAVFLDPAVILLDEPLGALDPIVRADVQQKLRDIFQRLKKTVLLVTHDISEAVYLGDEVTLLKDGHVLQSGRMEDFVRAPKDPYVTQFIGAQRSWESMLK